MENRWETGGESGPRSVKSEMHTVCPGAVWRAVCCNCVKSRASWMRDEWS